MTIEQSGQTSEHKKRDLTITVPGQYVRTISEGACIETELLALLAFCTGKGILTDESESEIIYDAFSQPVSRTMHYGDLQYGLYMQAEPLTSGFGVHGEYAHWQFKGLHEGIEISAESRLDMRGGSGSFYSVKINGDNSMIDECINFLENNFAAEIKKIILQ